ncbi:MAG: transposase [Pirellulales bacterium]|nr:transposase [Pirellulales bacterium]
MSLVENHHRKRCRRFDVPGDAHFLTFSCFKRLPLLNRDRSRRWMVDAIDLGRRKAPFDLWAFVIMPEHVHLVLLPKDGARISSMLTTMKQSVSKRAILWLKENAPHYLERITDHQPNGKQHHRFWQRGGGYDRNLRSVRDIHEKIRYVHENPVRRQMVERTTDYQWSSARAWNSGVDSPLRIDRESVPPLTTLDDRIDSTLMQ